ncbi:MAG: 30S ribosomal protein S16 [bacterium]|nr:30S ribosomal protein S16 [bacterium]
MATVIRLKRGGRTHAPYYRLVVMDSRARTRGRELEQIGVYHPCARPEPQVEVDRPKALAWLQKGAQMSDTARSILSKQGLLVAFVDGAKPEDLVEPAAVEESAPAEAPAEAVAEAPAVEETPAPAEPEAEAAPESAPEA